jgi:ABC-2 type transport system permease protein
MRNALIVFRKELGEIAQQRGLVVGILMPVILFTVLPLLAITGVGGNEGGLRGIGRLGVPAVEGLDNREGVQALVGMQVSTLFLLMPSLLTSIIAAYTIIGEKTARTLEPLLATPIRTWELLIGKGLVAVVPGIVLTWLTGVVFLLGLHRFAITEKVFLAVASPGWMITFLVWTPLLGIVAVSALIMISSRVNDPRTAQQLSSAIVLPFLVLFLGQASGWLTLGVGVALTIAGILALIAASAVWGATRVFQRDVILTRWK